MGNLKSTRVVCKVILLGVQVLFVTRLQVYIIMSKKSTDFIPELLRLKDTQGLYQLRPPYCFCTVQIRIREFDLKWMQQLQSSLGNESWAVEERRE